MLKRPHFQPLHFHRPPRLVAALIAAVILVPVLQAGEIRVKLPSHPGTKGVVDTFMRGPVEYLNVEDLAAAFSIGFYTNSDVDKTVLYFRGGEVKVTAFSSFIVVEDRAYQMTTPSYFDGKSYFVPAKSFFDILGRSVLPGSRYDESRRLFIGAPASGAFNIHSAVVESKSNGTLIRIKTSRLFDGKNIVRYITDNGWLVVQVPGGKVDTTAMAQSQLGGLIRSARGRQLKNSGEIRFRLTDRVSLPEIYQVDDGAELHISIRNPVGGSEKRADDIRKQWYLDTIVLDPGHGGKDPGTTSPGGLKEKTITLDVARRLGRLLKQKSDMRVVYTRDEDVFVPLFQRTRLANEAGGKIFISIHVNGVENRSARGFEAWLLAPANTPEAIEMARRENGVIALEESNHPYVEFSDESLILSTMAHSAWMRESEFLGAAMLDKFTSRLDTPNRGLKQTELIVLIGAAMPKILVEIGFISNRLEEKKLGQSEYRQKIAQSMFEAIIEFKKKYDGTLRADKS